jgi:hypothetical protein
MGGACDNGSCLSLCVGALVMTDKLHFIILTFLDGLTSQKYQVCPQIQFPLLDLYRLQTVNSVVSELGSAEVGTQGGGSGLGFSLKESQVRDGGSLREGSNSLVPS